MSLFHPSKNNKCARVSGVRLSLKNQRVVWENIASKNHCFGSQKKIKLRDNRPHESFSRVDSCEA